MSASNKDRLSGLVNASGFPFQMAVETSIRQSAGTRWTILASECPWHDHATNKGGFADLVVRRHVAPTWVIECKRPRGGEWVFLVPDGESEKVAKFRCLWASKGREGNLQIGWDELDFKPESLESSFCVVRGSGEGHLSLLERLAAQLVQSVDCLAQEDINDLDYMARDIGIYMPIIVTTAALFTCRFDPAKISLATGMLPQSTFEAVPLVRYRKAFAPTAPPGEPSPRGLPGMVRSRERSVLVVHAESLIDTMHEADLITTDIMHVPWVRGAR